MKHLTLGVVGLAVAIGLCLEAGTSAQSQDHARVIEKNCVTCHNERVKSADLILGNTPLEPSAAPFYRHGDGSPLYPTGGTS